MTSRAGLWPALRVAVVAAGTTGVTLVSWRGFTEEPSRFLVPALALGLALAVLGATLRWLRLPVLATLGVQLLASSFLVAMVLTGSAWPGRGTRTELVSLFEGASESIRNQAAPVSADVPGIHPILIVLALGCVLLVDLLAAGYHRIPVSGIVLLTVYSVPVSLLGGGVPWWLFAAAAAGFLLLLYLQEEDRLLRWGRSLAHPDRPVSEQGLRPPIGGLRLRAVGAGSVATAAAVVAPFVIPTLSISLFSGGFGAGDGNVSITNPMTDLVRDLNQGEDLALVDVTTDDPDPSYLRVAVLTWFTDNEWRAGDREIPADQVAAGAMPPGPGLIGNEPGEHYDYRVQLTDNFDTRWLPVYPEVLSMLTVGDWRYDLRTMDFFAPDKSTSSLGMSYSMRSVKVEYDALELDRAAGGVGSVDEIFTELPGDLPPLVGDLTVEAVGNAPTKFQQARALQRWFRSEGGFDYDLERAPSGNGSAALVQFLTEGPRGRVGYCEQFASAMAVMARTINIPSRVAVGFLNGQRTAQGTVEFSSHDLHAWPELYFPGSGWVRFEPTPGQRAESVPAWTTQRLPEPTTAPSASTSAAQPTDSLPTQAESSLVPSDSATTGTSSGSDGGGIPWTSVLLTLAVALLTAGLLLAPRTLRRARRERRWRDPGGPEAAWAELRDTVVDLGEAWPAGLSPRATARWLGGRLGRPGAVQVARPQRGRGQSPEAAAALDRLVGAVEALRYARPRAREWVGLRDDVELVVGSLVAGATPEAGRRAAWWPASTFSRRSTSAMPTDPGDVTTGFGVVDHVG